MSNTKALIDDDVDTFDKNGIIQIDEYDYLKTRYDWTKNFQSKSFRWDFEGERPAKSIIVGGLFYVDASVIDDFGFKTEGGPHNDQNPECGRCNDIGVQYDGKRIRYRKETDHPNYTSNLVAKNTDMGDLRKKWVGLMCVSQEVTIKDNKDDVGVTGRRMRVLVDRDAKKTDGTLNNNYVQEIEILDLGQFVDNGKALPVYNESQCSEAQTTIRLDGLTENQIKFEGLFLANISPAEVIKNVDPQPVKIPPKVVVVPEVTVTKKGETFILDASQSEDPDGEIDCFIFKQVKPWMVGQRLGLKPLYKNDMGKLEVTYPEMERKPAKPLAIEVVVRDNDMLERSLTVTIIDNIDYGTPQPTGFSIDLKVQKTAYEVPQDKFPYTIPIQVIVYGGNPPYSKVITANPKEGIIVGQDSVIVNNQVTFALTASAIDMDGKTVADTENIVVKEIPVEPQPSGNVLYDSNVDIDWDAIQGESLKVTGVYGTFKPNGKYFRCKASGSPRAILYKATKEICLEHDGKYGRLYFGVCNYESMLEGEFKLQKTSHNASFKIRNRHQYADIVSNAPDNKRQGGQGTSYHFDSVDADLEVVHGTEIGGPSSNLSSKLEANKYYKFRFSQFDKNGKIHVIDELDYGDGKGLLIVNEGDVAAPQQFFNKADFDEFSEFWVRLNADEGGQLYIKNLKMTDLSKAREAVSL